MRQLTLAAAVLCQLACSPEDLAALTPPEAGVSELSHEVAVRFEGGAAHLTVTRKLHNDSAEVRTFTRNLTLPRGAIATSLRLGVEGRWLRQPVLSHAEDAAERWDALVSPGEAAPSTLALLQWSWNGGLDLELFGVAPGATVDVEYELELPQTYEAGELTFEYPASDPADPAPQFHLAQAPEATLENVLDEEPFSDRTPLAFRVHQPWSPRELADARWATYPLGADRTLWRLEVDLAAQLEAAPINPNVVFVVDASHSQGPAGIAAQLELIAPYLTHVPDAQVELVVYRRFAQRLFGRFVPAGDVARLLTLTPLSPGNGSNLELGAGLAAQALAQVGGTGRIVLFTDEQLREGFTNEAALTALSAAPRNTIVHVVSRDASDGELEENRNDEAPLSPVAAAHGGVFFRLSGHPGDPATAAKTVLGLVRPIRIDDFRVEARGLEEDRVEVESTQPEGSTVRMSAIGSRAPEEVTLTGKVWARDYRKVVPVDGPLADRLPGLAVGEDELRVQLSNDELKTAAFASRAVSPFTSYLSAPPDAAPSTAGVLSSGLGDLSMHGSGCSSCGGASSCGFWHSGRPAIDFTALLRDLLAEGVAACERQHGDSSLAALRLEATADEVVAVEVSAPSVEMSGCLTEAAWAIRLSAPFTAHRTYEVAF